MLSEDPNDAAVGIAVAADWSAGLAALHARIAPRFARAEPRRHALAYLRALLGPLPPKAGWRLPAHAAVAPHDGIERLLHSAVWDEDMVRDDLRAYVVEHLGQPGAVLLVADLGLPKRGHKSVGVIRQYNPTTGRAQNCQVGVFLAYASREGCALVDRELYLPRVWAESRERCAEARVPPTVGYATRPELARRMLERAFAAGVDAAWVAGDATYGGDAGLRRWLEQRGQPYVMEVRGGEEVWLAGESSPVMARAAELAASLGPELWQWLPTAEGTPECAVDQWAWTRVAGAGEPDRHHWLLARRNPAKPGEPTYYRAYGPVGSALADLVAAAGQRQTVDGCFASGRAVGLDRYEVRHWRAWYRHVTLAMLAHAYLVISRQQATREERRTLAPWVQTSFLPAEAHD